ncbi:hypothetical protein V500_10427 [Pseudogymnoascus sp. VKM F-4518 (FW-2643)]|nr:hypothetical protein V500_10427 [Pseudogymnoascus sp. VKM F-4518 (FW-2643)]
MPGPGEYSRFVDERDDPSPSTTKDVHPHVSSTQQVSGKSVHHGSFSQRASPRHFPDHNPSSIVAATEEDINNDEPIGRPHRRPKRVHAEEGEENEVPPRSRRRPNLREEGGADDYDLRPPPRRLRRSSSSIRPALSQLTTLEEIGLNIIEGQEQIVGLLRSIDAALKAESPAEKGNGSKE